MPLSTYVLIFNIDGTVYYDNEVPGSNKYEGIELSNPEIKLVEVPRLSSEFCCDSRNFEVI